MDANMRYLVESVRAAMVVFHYPRGRMTSLTPECAGCGEPIWRVDGAWHSTLTDSDVCTGAATKRPTEG